MAEPRATARPRRPGWLPLAAAALVVPTVLAGLTLLWPRSQIEADLARAGGEALRGAGLDGYGLALDGRDATVSGVAGPDAQRAVAAVAAVPGIRVASAPGGPDGAAGSGGAGGATGGGSGGEASPTGADASGAPSVAPSTAPSAGAPSSAAGADPGTPPTAAAPTPEPDPAAAVRAAVAELLAASPITFAPDSPDLTPEGAAVIARVLELVRPVPSARLQVDGYVAAGPRSGRLTAQELSDRRAAVVRDALVAGGVPAGSVTVRGLGEGPAPVPDAAGRRAVITVL